MIADTRSFEDELSLCLQVRYPILQVTTYEEDRAIRSIADVAERLECRVLIWSASQGVHDINGTQLKPEDLAKAAQAGGGAVGEAGGVAAHGGRGAFSDLAVALELFHALASAPKVPRQSYVFILLDPEAYLGDKAASPIYRRKLRDYAAAARRADLLASFIIISPVISIPAELDKEVTALDFPLPSREEVKAHIRRFLARADHVKALSVDTSPAFLDRMVDAAVGLTMFEIDNVIAKTIIKDHAIDQSDLGEIFLQKQQIIRRTGILEYQETSSLGMEQVGGLALLKRWLAVRATAFSADARAFGVQPPKGVLVTGVPGCGKSWSAKCVAAAWNMPLIRLDMGKVYSSYIGSSEHRMREAIRTCEAVSPCVLWIDEIEKSFPSLRGHDGDGGTSARVFASFLTWMQEKTAPVFVFATANQIENLPAEMLRKGRFDEIFFVDLPGEGERRQILEIQLARAGRSGMDLDQLVALSGPGTLGPDVSLTGSEIASWVNDALLEAYQRRITDPGADLAMADFEAVGRRIVPLARMRANDISRLRLWAAEHATGASEVPGGGQHARPRPVLA